MPGPSVSRTRSPSGCAQYLLKGGFLWVDDFWGTAAWDHWAAQIQLVLPPPDTPSKTCRWTIRCCTRMFEMTKIPQITNILFWRQNGDDTSERGTDSEDVHLRAIRDANGGSWC